MSLAEAKKVGYPKNEEIYQWIIKSNAENRDAKLQDQEAAFLALGREYGDHKEVAKLQQLIATGREVTTEHAKSKSAKIVRTLLDDFERIPGSEAAQIETIQECVEWAVLENRAFLRQNLELRLIALWHKTHNYQKAIDLIQKSLRELKKLDDKMGLVEVQLLEARVYHSLRNLAKARASLTSARTSANSIYCPTRTQAELDTMSGILQAEDGDYKTAFSYFYEALDGYSSLDDPYAVNVVKYLLLVKIMLSLTDDLEQLMTNKTVLKYQGPDIDVMLAVARAHKNRSLQEFEKVLAEHKDRLSNDPFIRAHFSALYDKLLQENLVKVIEPYSCVEISFLAKQLGLDTRQVEGKLGQMILDKAINGVLDQGNGWLFIYPEQEADTTYEFSLETIQHMSNVVDMLYDKAGAIQGGVKSS